MKKLIQRPNFITFFTINLLFTTTVTWDMIKVVGCSEEFMGKQQFYSNAVHKQFQNLIQRDVYLTPRLQ